jgi:hypothetical protein
MLGLVSISLHLPGFGLNNSDEPLEETDLVPYFRIHHDARFSLQLRKALDLWGAGADVRGTKIRPLKGVCLLLVDQMRTPVLVC